MVKQKLISFKCDSHQLEILDSTCELMGVKRNTLLNFLVYYANNNAQFYSDFCKIIVYQRVLVDFDDDDK